MPLTFSLYSVAGLLIMLGIGLFDIGIYQRWLYPVMRRKHEAAKVTGSHGQDPNVMKAVIRIFSLVVLPALGFLFGDPIITNLLR